MSPSAIDEFEARYESGIPLATAADEEVSEEYGGIIYTIKPGEIFRLKDRKEHPRDPKTGVFITTAPPVTAEAGAAGDIVRALLMHDRMGRLGVYLVMGDGKDDQRRAAARQIWLKARSEVALAVQAHWMREVKAAESVPGALPPTMPERVRKHVKWLRDHSQEVQLVGRKRYVVKIDSNDFDTYQDATSYVETVHGNLLLETGTKSEDHVIDSQSGLTSKVKANVRAAAEAAPEFDPPAVETPIVDESNRPSPGVADTVRNMEAGAALLKAATALGIELTRGEKQSLKAGDTNKFSAVRKQIEEAKATQAGT